MWAAFKFLLEFFIVLAFLAMVLAWLYLLGYSSENLYNLTME